MTTKPEETPATTSANTNASNSNSNSNSSDSNSSKEEEMTQEVDDKGNDGSVSDNEEEEDGDEDDSAHGLPKGGLCWQSDQERSSSRASSEVDMNVETTRASVEEKDKEKTTKDNSADEKTSKEDNKRKRETTTTGKKSTTSTSVPEDDKDDNDNGPPSKLNEYQRQLRNAREKRRSGKICDQFDHIRDTMVKAGVIVPKGTKGTILAAAKEYISMLQEQQRRIVV